MRLNDEKMQEARDARVRAIVREEIVAALQVLGRAAASEYLSTESEIAERALRASEDVFTNAAHRLTCEHNYRFGQGRCWDCDEPEPEPVNPFETKEG